jgi:hypothetical protein
MTYIRRACKYFLQICLIFIVIIGALMAFGLVSKDVAVAFQKGWTSIGYIAALFAAMSAAYPAFGYGKRKIRAQGDPAEHKGAILEAMEARGYRLEKELPEGGLRFRLSSGVARAARIWEDAVTIQPVLGGFQAEGLVRDLSRVVMAIDHKINHYEY